MTLQLLEHFTIDTVDLQRSIDFYTNVLGLRNGDRPNFDFPGAWLYCGERAVVHLIGGKHSAHGTGSLNHVAFRSQDRPAFVKKLEALGIAYEMRKVPDFPLHQVFLFDPDGVKIELNFWEEEQKPTGSRRKTKTLSNA